MCAGPGQRICLASRQAADWLAGWAFGAGPCSRDGQDNCSQCTLSVQACQESVIHGENSRRKCLQAAVRHRLCGGREPPGQGEKRTREGRWFDASSSGRAQAVVQTSSCLSETLILKRAMQKYKRKCESCDIMSMTSFSRGEYALVLPREHKEHLVLGTPCAACTRPGQTISWFLLRIPAGRLVRPACCRHAVFCRP